MKLELLKYQELLLENLILTKRFLFDEISDNSRLTGIVGLRGVGKTTILLQKLKEIKESSIYFSMDNPNVSNKGLLNIVSELHLNYNINNYYIDEIHKYNNWNQELKNIYDSFPKVKVLFSGSSSIDIIKGSYDLSRRAIIHKLSILSFREFLNIKYDKNYPKLDIDSILFNQSKIEDFLIEVTKIPIIEEFKNYLSSGEFPFFLEGNKKEYLFKLENAINKIIYEDIVSFYKLKTENIGNLKQILFFIINSEPGLLSINSLSKFLKISNDSVANYINILEEIGLLNIVNSYGNISQSTRKSKKAYLSFSNINSIIQYKLLENTNIGRIRESFLVSNFKNIGKEIYYHPKGDFVFTIGDKDVVIEIGGRNKTQKQIKNIENSFIVIDDILLPSNTKIPLWLFGFLY